MTPHVTTKLVVIGVLLLSMTISSKSSEVKTSLVYAYNIFTKDIAIVRHTITSVNVPSPVECFRHCAKVCGCVAFQLTGTSCELLDTDKDDADGDLVTREGTFLYTMQGAGIEEMKRKRKPGANSSASCKDIYLKNTCRVNKAYKLQTDIGRIPVYCHMTGIDGCGDGGWTLVMKIDGHKSTFHYDSKFWSNKTDFNLPGGETGFDNQETKLPTYWNTNFSKICLGMRIGNQPVKFLVISKNAASLYSLIADDRYRPTSLGRDKWKTLLGSEGSLQINCTKEGFNAVGDRYHSKARIGIIGNNQNKCETCDSRIGFGTGGQHDDTNTCGIEATRKPDNGERHIKTMGYILVK